MATPASDVLSRRASGRQDRSSQMILVVEDEPAVREMVADNFRMAGYPVEEACDVASARRIVSEKTPSLVLLDWMLPDASGLEFLRSLRSAEATASLPVIMLTARGDEPDRIRGLDGGAVHTEPCRKPDPPRQSPATCW